MCLNETSNQFLENQGKREKENALEQLSPTDLETIFLDSSKGRIIITIIIWLVGLEDF